MPPPSKKRKEDQKKHGSRLAKLKRVENLARDMNEDDQRVIGTSSGIIKSLTLHNFMCHQSFHQTWNENLNFIIGENGSGKSALLSGLLVGLGARALSTSRTSSIKELVKTGTTFARTEVTLFNRGLLDEDEYGEEFTIQRTIDIKGTSTYKLQKDGLGKFRPLKKQELDKIIHDLNIQLENPVAVLNQEAARSFLCSKNPKDKYKLFQDGIGAGSCESTLEEIKIDLDSILDNLNRKKESTQRASASYNQLKEKVKIIEGIKVFKDQLKQLGQELAWAYVAADKKVCIKFKKELESSNEEYAKCCKTLQDGVEEKERFEEEIPSESDQTDKIDEQNRLERLKKERKEIVDKLKREISSAKRGIAENVRKISQQQNYVRKLEEKAAQDNEKEKQDYEALREQIREQQESLQDQISTLEKEVKSLQTDGDFFRQGAEALKQEIDSIRSKCRDMDNIIQNKKSQINRLKSTSSQNAYVAFGPKMQTLVDKIQANAHRFKHQPKGPIGSKIKVKEQKYVKIIQFVLRSRLCDFIVDNNKDASVLNEFIAEIYGTTQMRDNPRPNVHMNKFCDAFDYGPTNASKGIDFPTIIDMLDIENNDSIITNGLLDICSAERILLFKDTKEALSILEDRYTTPKSCICGFTLDFFKVTPDPNLRIDVQFERSNVVQLIRTSTSMQVKELQMEIRALEEKRSEYVLDESKVKEERKLRAEFEKRIQLYREKRALCSSLTLKLKSLKDNIVAPPDNTSRNEELLEVREEIAKLQAEIENHEEILSRNQPLVQEKEAERKQIDADIQKVGQELINYQDTQDKIKERARKLDLFIARLKKRLEERSADKENAEENLRTAEEKVATSLAKAMEIGEEVEVKKSVDQIVKESQLIKVKINEIEKNIGDRDSIYNNFEEAKKKYVNLRNNFEMVNNIYKHLRSACCSVEEYYWNSRKRLIQSLKDTYQRIVSSRNYKGQVIIDDDRQELYYFICPDKEASKKLSLFEGNLNSANYKKQMQEYVAGLSGGERSFSTICFIISLWQGMRCPFYMLDEFDVFMDAINRKVSQLALHSHSKLNQHRQFFLFTPLDLASVPAEDEAVVLKMYPPNREATQNNQS